MDIVDVLNQINKIGEDTKDKIAPFQVLKKFKSGRSAAGVYMVEYGSANRVGILKVTKNNEGKVFQKAYALAVENNMQKYIAKLISSYKIQDKSKATFYVNLYDLAGDDIYNSMTFLDKVLNEDELKDTIISTITKFLFTWNKEHVKQNMSPMDIVKNELSYRYMDSKYIKSFESMGIDKNIKWISLDGTDILLPNPYYYFNNENVWNNLKVICLTSYAHGDFQGDNIIITENKPIIIDFCDLLEDCNVFHDLRYLESITIGDCLEIDKESDRELWTKVCESLSAEITDVELPQGKGMTLLRQLVSKLRENVKLIVCDSRNSLYDPSFHLAGMACGLINMRKYPTVNKKKAAFIYAAFNLKNFLKDEAVNMYDPKLDSCMVFNWKNQKIGNQLVVLEPTK
ncbi:hypothetical protein [Clostridium tagluense]|uniref:Aminoglycoside phosphotransferase domain-containing protein n=1 Tax=Clostridium tagluense TaxID=360422 RepID=A0A401UGY6_9CLOT|nr:hypothetical protein [Clostridium tagluense]MCB2296333.1 hypothetical protein [Clostridium tagluense]GCD08749.1 hypothetical protein Ctaglu_03720 [Clostridium tagluense]